MKDLKTSITINTKNILRNKKDGGDRPAFIIVDDDGTRYACEINILYPCNLSINDNKVIVSTKSRVELVKEYIPIIKKSGRPRKYASNAERQSAYRKRKQRKQ